MSRKITLNETSPPFVVNEVKVDGIARYDLDNAYPTRMERIIDASISAKSSAAMLKRFCIGDGFVNQELNKLVTGIDPYGRPRTLYHLLADNSKSIAYNAGFYNRLRYNLHLKVDAVRPEKFKECRFGKLDSKDFGGKIVVYNNWDKQRKTRYHRDQFNIVDIYNPNEQVIVAQIKGAEGIDQWKGQIFFWFENDDYVYPTSPIDPVLYDADTEKQISLFKNGELRRGFFGKYFIHHTAFDNDQDADKFKDGVKKMTGGGHEYSSMVLEGEFDENGVLKEGANVKVEPIEQNINDELFKAYEASTINNIRKAYNAIPQILIDYEDGKLGTTSGEALVQAAEFYNQMTQDLRTQLSMSYKEIFRNWVVDMGDEDFVIKPLELFKKPVTDG